MKTRLIPMLLVLLVGGLIVAGCGDDDEGGSDTGATAPAPAETATTESAPPEETTTEESGGGGGETIENPADPSGQLKFEKDALTAKAGKVTLSMPNESSVPHAIAIRADGKETEGETVQAGGTSEASADLKAGEYEFYCPVPGHEEGGMKGTLTVE
jgi:uncharacterized cupredoxin-like copper-binding protein